MTVINVDPENCSEREIFDMANDIARLDITQEEGVLLSEDLVIESEQEILDVFHLS